MAFNDSIANHSERLRMRYAPRRRDDMEWQPVGSNTGIWEGPRSGSSGGRAELKIVSVDFQEKANAANHHCEKFELVERGNSSVIRRGGAFAFEITFNLEVDLKKEYELKCYISFGTSPRVQNGTQAILTVCGKTKFDLTHEDWDIRTVKQRGHKVTLEVQVPTDVAVGMWRLALIVTRRSNPSERLVQRLDHDIFILFNPWNKDDTTYMPDTEKLEELVLNDVGKVWIAIDKRPRGRHWAFGQFDDVVLPACVLLLEKSGLSPAARADPVRVARTISKMVNSNDDNGVLEGRWDQTYPGGTPPGKWTGSIAILEQYMETNRPVKYGQCWVFASVVNTVCRALGLPSRVVTNYNSAHDQNESLTIDKYYNEDSEEIFYDPTGNDHNDSIWNFHVWNDVWMARPDLPPGYGGWQAIDATPQELSDGANQCGPASHEAIRRGEVNMKYDVPFIMAEVNADIVRWQVDSRDESNPKIMDSNRHYVGRRVLTKKPGDIDDSSWFQDDKEEITTSYKHKEGTPAERAVLIAAARRLRNARHAFGLQPDPKKDVEFSIVEIEDVLIGEDFTFTVRAKNISGAVRTVFISERVSSCYYTGAKAYDIVTSGGEVTLKPNEEKSLSLPVRYSDYYKKLVEHCIMKLVAICKVKETSYTWIGDDNFHLLKPTINIEILAKAVVGKPLGLKFSFTNTLPMALKGCSLVVEGPGIIRPKTIPIDDVSPRGEMNYWLRVFPKKPTGTTLIVTFNSLELVDLTGSKKILVSAA